VTGYKRLLPLIFIFLIAGNLCAQISGAKFIQDVQSPVNSGSVTILQNDEIARLVDRHLYEESKKKGIVGYRIRVFSNSGSLARKEGEGVMSEFIQKYDDIKTYFNFDSPFYRLYVGDFRTRSEAMKCLKKIEHDFPDAFIVRSKINYPSL
jgi:hypothetical protein